MGADVLLGGDLGARGRRRASLSGADAGEWKRAERRERARGETRAT